MKTLKTIIHLTIVLLSMKIEASVLSVPANYSTIQSAINASINGDTIVVSTGTYFENINFRGKNITLTSLYYLNLDTSYISSTIINGSIPVNSDTASCVIFNSGEDSTAVLQGFTITGRKFNQNSAAFTINSCSMNICPFCSCPSGNSKSL